MSYTQRLAISFATAAASIGVFLGFVAVHGANDAASTGSQLAARYHSRGRVERFFKRATKSAPLEVAARYHSRGRVERFFKRAKGTTKTKRSSLKGRPLRRRLIGQDEQTMLEDVQLAARYHSRKRTARFFKRVTC